jgi:hypothetical protein
VSSILGCDSETFLSRARGEAKGQDRLGSIYELSLHLYESDMEVVLIDADRITSDAPLHTLQQEPYTISHEMIGASPKSRVVCAVLWNHHFDLGAVQGLESPNLVFRKGPEWETAHLLILQFIQGRTSAGVRTVLAPRWEPPVLLNELDCVNECGIETKRFACWREGDKHNKQSCMCIEQCLCVV